MTNSLKTRASAFRSSLRDAVNAAAPLGLPIQNASANPAPSCVDLGLVDERGQPTMRALARGSEGLRAIDVDGGLALSAALFCLRLRFACAGDTTAAALYRSPFTAAHV